MISKQDIQAMSDEELMDAFESILGVSELYCGHCRGSKPIRTHFVCAIRVRCMKPSCKGLDEHFKVPKCCDRMKMINDRANPINNPAYSEIRKAATEEDVERLQIKRRDGLLGAGIMPRAYHGLPVLKVRRLPTAKDIISSLDVLQTALQSRLL